MRKQRLELKAAAGDRFFDLAELKLPSDDADALEHILAFAEDASNSSRRREPWEGELKWTQHSPRKASRISRRNEVLSAVLEAHAERPACLTCSFQAEDMIALSLLRKRIPSIPVLFLDTGYHFAQTYEYRDWMVKEWSLNLVNVVPKETVERQESEFGILYRSDPTKCCQLRKVEPLFHALEPYEIWFTGLRREQSPTRKNLKKVEEHQLPRWKKTFESQPAGRLDLGASLGVHGQKPDQLFAPVRPGIFEHRLRALHGDSRRSE